MTTIKCIIFLMLPAVYYSQEDRDKFIFADMDITVEKPDKNKSYDVNYNDDNQIYKLGKKLTYSYYIVRNNDRFLVKKGEQEIQQTGHTSAGWKFVESEKKDDETIQYITIEPHQGNPFASFDPNYNQTAVDFTYLMKNNESFSMETTGAIENKMNVWLHPPRNIYFKILELNPFPYIKAPYAIGTKWNWNLEIGDHWSDKRWLKWEGKIENKYEYEIKEKKTSPRGSGTWNALLFMEKQRAELVRHNLSLILIHSLGL